jgi:phosphatidylinositol 4-kinase
VLKLFRDLFAIFPNSPGILEVVGWVLAQHFVLYSSWCGSPEVVQFTKPPIEKVFGAFRELLNCPSAILPITDAFSITDQVITEMKQAFQENRYHVALRSAALIARAQCDHIGICSLIRPGQAIGLLNEEVLTHQVAASYLVRCLEQFTTDELLQYIPQLVQSVRFDDSEILRQFLCRVCPKSQIFAHRLIWNVQCEKCKLSSRTDNLPLQLVPLEGTILEEFSPSEQIFREHEFALIDKLEVISQFLLPLPIDERPKHLVNKLAEMAISDDLYVPSNPNYHIIQINASQSRPLKSHSRVPILVSFMVYDEEDPNKKPFKFSCIFKTQDDVRMDAMMIQFIDKFQRIFQEVGLPTYMNAYKVFATGEGRGVIQCIQNAKSRHEIGMERGEDLSSYFARTYGPPWSNSFMKAQSNFVASLAPYSLLCYIFQVKDRHNANIMIDGDGHVLHIDFGFIFDISPGNIRFEANTFKLNTEMVQLMGGKDGQSF